MFILSFFNLNASSLQGLNLGLDNFELEFRLQPHTFRAAESLNKLISHSTTALEDCARNVMSTFSEKELEDARKFIDKLRVDNGGISREDREFLERERPNVLISLESVRRKLGASTRMFVSE